MNKLAASTLPITSFIAETLMQYYYYLPNLSKKETGDREREANNGLWSSLENHESYIKLDDKLAKLKLLKRLM